MFLESDIRTISEQLKIDAVGFAPIGLIVESEWKGYNTWLQEGKHADMSYMERYPDQRQQPELLLEGAKSVITIAVNYFPPILQGDKAPQIAKYALSRDYHKVIKKLLDQLAEQINRDVATHQYRTMVDTAPIFERYWAEQSGIGFRGRNSNLIVPQVGSFVFLGEILTTLELQTDLEQNASCGSCKRCINACPTEALDGRSLDARRCINYLTIEHRESIPQELSSRFGTRLYGCDTCQDVCPYNRSPQPSSHFKPFPKLINLERSDLIDLNQERYAHLFYGTPITRAKLKGMQRNAHIYLSNNPLQS